MSNQEHPAAENPEKTLEIPKRLIGNQNLLERVDFMRLHTRAKNILKNDYGCYTLGDVAMLGEFEIFRATGLGQVSKNRIEEHLAKSGIEFDMFSKEIKGAYLASRNGHVSLLRKLHPVADSEDIQEAASIAALREVFDIPDNGIAFERREEFKTVTFEIYLPKLFSRAMTGDSALESRVYEALDNVVNSFSGKPVEGAAPEEDGADEDRPVNFDVSVPLNAQFARAVEASPQRKGEIAAQMQKEAVRVIGAHIQSELDDAMAMYR